MKKMSNILAALLCTYTCTCACSCSFFRLEDVGLESGTDIESGNGDGTLTLSFSSACDDEDNSSHNVAGEALAGGISDSMETLLFYADSNIFKLTLRDAAGEMIFDDIFGNFPETVTLNSGFYDLTVASTKDNSKTSNSPQWAESRQIAISENENVKLQILCTQNNCGICLEMDHNFHTDNPNAVLLLLDSQGEVVLESDERRTTFLDPGEFRLRVVMNGTDEITSTTFKLKEGENFKVRIREECGQVKIDSCRNAFSTVLRFGNDDCTKGSSADNAYTVSQMRKAVGKKGVWVGGYIVGGDLSAKNISFSPPFTAASNIALGPKSCCISRDACISVQLPSGKVRNSLNLQTNPELLGHYVLLKGEVAASYFGLTGLKNVSEYILKGQIVKDPNSQ